MQTETVAGRISLIECYIGEYSFGRSARRKRGHGRVSEREEFRTLLGGEVREEGPEVSAFNVTGLGMNLALVPNQSYVIL